MAFADIPKVFLIKFIILVTIVVFSFILFSELLDIPFQESLLWNLICWGVVNSIIIVLLFFFRDWKLSIEAMQQKIAEFKKRNRIANSFFIADLILNAFCITFFVFVGSAYLTMFFAKTPFSENMKLVSIKCKESIGGRYSPLPSFTTIRFINKETHKKLILTFRGDICIEEPNAAKYLLGKDIKLRGRECFFGRFYDKIDRQK